MPTRTSARSLRASSRRTDLQIAIWARFFATVGKNAPRKRNETHRAQIDGYRAPLMQHQFDVELIEPSRQTPTMAIVSFPRRLADLAAAAPDRAGGDVRWRVGEPRRAGVACQPLGPGPCWAWRRPRRLRHGRAAELDRVVRRLRRLLEAGCRAAAGLGEAAAPRAGRDRRPRPVEGRPRRRAGCAGGNGVPAGRVPPARRPRRRPAAGCDVAGVEGADLGRIDRPAQAHRVRRSGRARHGSARRRCCWRSTAAS